MTTYIGLCGDQSQTKLGWIISTNKVYCKTSPKKYEFNTIPNLISS